MFDRFNSASLRSSSQFEKSRKFIKTREKLHQETLKDEGHRAKKLVEL